MHLLVQMDERTEPKLVAMPEKSQKDSAYVSHVRGRAEQGRAIPEKGMGGRYKPSSRAGPEQVQDRVTHRCS